MYKLISSASILRLADNALIPTDLANVDYVAFLNWQGAGNVPEPAEVPDPKLAIQAQIDTIERETMMNRGVRESMLYLMLKEAAAVGADPMENIAYAKFKAIDDQIRALRSQL